MAARAPAEANAAYCAGLCRDCRTRPYSPGRTRCDECHAAYLKAPIEGTT